MNFILPGTLMSGMVNIINYAREPTLSLVFCAPPTIFLGFRGSTFIVGIFIFIFLLLPRLSRILKLHGLHRIHLGRFNESLSNLGGGHSS
jgi:hypothetical protein